MVSLRPLVMRDAAVLTDICNQMQVAQFLAHMPHPFRPKHAKRFVQFGSENPGLVFGIVADRTLVGALQMRDELEYFLTPKVWGRGIATKAVEMAVDHYFQTTAHRQMNSGYFTQNRASARVLVKLGFQKGTLRTIGTRHLAMATHQSMHLTRVQWQRTQTTAIAA